LYDYEKLYEKIYFVKRIKSERGNTMAETKKNILTYSGLKKLEEELQDLKVNKRKEVAAKIKEAREQGDLSENAEYDAAKDEQRDIEARIEDIEKILKNAEVVDEDDIDLQKINIGCKVKIKKINGGEAEFSIVGSTEVNSREHKISNESPLGRGLIGHEIGDIVTIEAPAGDIEYEVIDIQKVN
jgi:transcription elongation factor GreA